MQRLSYIFILLPFFFFLITSCEGGDSGENGRIIAVENSLIPAVR